MVLTQKISLFKQVTGEITSLITLGEACQMISTGEAFGLCFRNTFTEIKNADEKAKPKLKLALPCFMFSALFKGTARAENITAELPFIIMDFDTKEHPDTDFALRKQQLCEDPYVLVVFDSPSGGLKVLLRYRDNSEIPTPLPPNYNVERVQTFTRIATYFKDKYQLIADASGKNINRACYLSYDPFIHINENADIFPAPPEKKPPPPPEKTAPTRSVAPQKNATDLKDKVREILSSPSLPNIAETHDAWVQIAHALATEYGAAGYMLLENILHKRSNWGAKPESYYKSHYENILRNNTRKVTLGTLVQILQQHNLLSEKKYVANKKLKPLPDPDFSKAVPKPFTDFQDRYGFFELKNSGGFKLSLDDFHSTLSAHGFFAVTTESQEFIARIEKGIIYRMEEKDILLFFVQLLRTLPQAINLIDTEQQPLAHCERKHILNFFLNHKEKYLNPLFLCTLPPLFLDYSALEHPDTEAYLYYQNGVAVTDAEGTKFMDYATFHKEKKRYVFAHERLARDYIDTQAPSDIARFIDLGSQTPLPEGGWLPNKERAEWLRVLLGFLLHNSFAPDLCKAVIFSDSARADGAAQGRSGKGLLGKIIKYAIENPRTRKKSFTIIDGKNFDPNYAFRYQNINPTTRIIAIEDVKNKYRVENHYNEILEGFEPMKKGFAPFHIMAKLILTTNESILVESESSRDRFLSFSLAHYFNKDHKPKKEFGKAFFTKWNAQEWNAFDSFMHQCQQAYFRHLKQNEGNIVPPTDTIDYDKKLQDLVSPDLLEWAEEFNEGKGFEHEKQYNKTELYKLFRLHMARHNPKQKVMHPQGFFAQLRLLKKYGDTYLEDTKKNGKFTQEGKSGNLRWITFLRTDTPPF